MTVSLPLEKQDKLRNQICRIFIKRSCRIRVFTRLLGFIVSACPAIQYRLLYTKPLERAKFPALTKSESGYARMAIPPLITPVLQW